MTDDRRTFERFSLRVKVLMLQQRSPCPLVAMTTNISRDGFLCSIPTELTIGEHLRCLILLADPTVRFGSQGGLCIAADVKVVHVSPDAESGSFATGFRMMSYQIESASAVRRFTGEANMEEREAGADLRFSVAGRSLELAKGHSTG